MTRAELVKYFSNPSARPIAWKERYIINYLTNYNIHKKAIIDMLFKTKIIMGSETYDKMKAKRIESNRELLEKNMMSEKLIQITPDEADSFLDKVYANYAGDKGPIDITDDVVENFFKFKISDISKVKLSTSLDREGVLWNEVLRSIKTRLSDEYLEFTGQKTDLDNDKKAMVAKIRREYEGI